MLGLGPTSTQKSWFVSMQGFVVERPPGVPFQKIQFGTDRAAGVLLYLTPGPARVAYRFLQEKEKAFDFRVISRPLSPPPRRKKAQIYNLKSHKKKKIGSWARGRPSLVGSYALAPAYLGGDLWAAPSSPPLRLPA